jgi:hypothetical protein
VLPFSLKESRQANPLQVSQRGPYGEKYPLSGHFYLSLNISLFIFYSQSPVREPHPCSITGSPWAVILRHQSHWSTFYSFIHSFIHSCISAGVPKKEPPYIHKGKNVRSPSTEPHADGKPTYNGVRPGSLLSLPQCYAAFGTIPSTLAWVDQSPVSQHVSWQPPSGYTHHNCYRLSRDIG